MSDSSSPFTHGVASFDPTDGAVLLWTRLDGTGTGALTWVVARDPELADVVASGEATPGLESDGTVVVDATGLAPATTYYYRFTVDDERSPLGRTRTLPAGPTDRFRLAMVCCARYASGPLAVYRALADHDVDVVLHVGDYIYEDPTDGGPREHEPDADVVSLDEYRARYAQMSADPDVRALHQSHPMIAIWDDHDLADNAWRHGAKGHDPETQGSWEERARAAARARSEWVPSRLREPENLQRQWRSFAVGDLAELVMLDTRFEGRDQQADADDAPDLHDPNRSMLGDEQRAWAHERVADRTRPWSLVVSQVVMNEIRIPLGGAFRAMNRELPAGYEVIDGRAICTDEWDGYPAERDRLARVMANRGGGVVVLSGDVHSAWAFDGPCLDGRVAAVEFTCPSTTSTPMGRDLPVGGRLAERLLAHLDHVRWVDIEHFGYTVVDVTPTHVVGEWYFVDIHDPEAASVPAAAWRVGLEADPRLEELPVPGAATTDRPVPEAVAADRPGRPDDVLRRARRRRRGRRVVLGGVVLAAVVAALLRRGRRA